MRTLKGLIERGQSPWYDNLSRGLIESGELSALIEQGIVGVTSNPTIFDQAISKSSDYDKALAKCKSESKDAEQTYWDLVCTDISDAADLLRSTYDSTDGQDGYVSVEVSPLLAHHTAETIAQANELYTRIGRENVMIKIPATLEGIPAIEAVVANSIPVNVTLIFSQERYAQVIGAFKAGAQKADKVPASVASFFISRLDSKVDKALSPDSKFRGKAAVANAGIAYDMFEQQFANAKSVDGLQRPLWASTSTKNPDYSTTLYVDELIAKNTVNTLPGATIAAIGTNEGDYPTSDLNDHLEDLKTAWKEIIIQSPIDSIMKELEDEGVSSFEASYQSCLESISARLAQM
ncbi:MAG TPA: transaldolase [Acidimicrobiia bacterium]|nr:transaldolase [Acidimicrobiia bacterium]